MHRYKKFTASICALFLGLHPLGEIGTAWAAKVISPVTAAQSSSMRAVPKGALHHLSPHAPHAQRLSSSLSLDGALPEVTAPTVNSNN